jgi:hypothetical protein
MGTQQKGNTPQKVDYTEISRCKYLKCEDTCYGSICFCDLEAWGHKAECGDSIKNTCQENHHIIV